MMTVAGYVRVSKEEQAKNDISIPAQKSRIIACCQSQDKELHDLYVDDGYSVKNFDLFITLLFAQIKKRYLMNH